MDTSVPDRPESTLDQDSGPSGTLCRVFGFFSIDGLPKTITKEATWYPIRPNRTNKDSPTRRPHVQFQTDTKDIRTVTDKHGPTRTYTTTPRINTASVRTRRDLHPNQK
ncbi:hypothetical protein DPMN_069983 [Dreissena polymorpha]|uniref:Uncharacterized protein n=1 Tax=Dreissena polymorpha TaxID=45954 RepID=A0A9D3Z2F5_DREPO|nr:hypothetical protein DPMN_069983 [Dreissena polymorpha]